MGLPGPLQVLRMAPPEGYPRALGMAPGTGPGRLLAP
jgi:hypothetical protein